MKYALAAMVLLLFSCEKTDCEQRPDQQTGLIIRTLPRGYIAYDRQVGDLSTHGIRISTAEQYERVFSHCCTGRLETIDFTQFEVLGLTTVNQGCNSTYALDVKRDDATKQVTYTVTEQFCRRCSPVDGRGNFVIVPKLPDGYQVTFARRQ